MAKKLIFIGPLLLPVTGVSVVNASVRDCMESCNNLSQVIVLRTSSGGRLKHLGKLIKFTQNLCKLGWMGSGGVAYISIAGGPYQFLDIFYLILVRMHRMEVVVHHHSYNYINRYSRLTSFLLWISGKHSQHIVLGDEMEHLLCERYGLGNVHVVSNVAYQAERRLEIRERGDFFTVGFLSNICDEKGGELADLIELSLGRGQDIRFRIAGPFMSSNLESRFRSLASRYESIELLGPIYGSEKENFWGSIDFFVFPTRYRNEAEPMVLWESVRAGVPFCSYDRGVIAGIADEAPLCSVTTDLNEMCEQIAGAYCLYIENFDLYLARRESLIDYFVDRREINKRRLLEICESL